MRKVGWLVVFLLVLSVAQANLLEKPIVILIPSYNNKDWYESNLGSALSQNYSNFRIIYINDASTDGTGDLVQAFIQKWDIHQRVTFINNTDRCGALCNTYRGVWLCHPDEIVAILDGDDWFAHTDVLTKLNTVYADPDVWTTYGQFRYYPCGSSGWARALPQAVIEENTVRYYDWVTTHLRTFYAGLFQKIDIRDLLFNNQFFSTAGDLAYTWPLIEMAGVHSRFIPDVLYVYNFASPLNDQKVVANLQMYYTYVIRAKTPYQPLKSLF